MTSTTDMAGHPDVAEISDLTEGLLPPSRSSDVRRHLDECELCADVYASLEEIRGLLGTLPGPQRMPADVAGRIDAALAAEALLNATGPEAADTSAPPSELPSGSEDGRDDSGARVSRETSAPVDRPAGRPRSSTTGPGRKDRTRNGRRRIAVLGTVFTVAALGLGTVLLSSLDDGTPPRDTAGEQQTTPADTFSEGKLRQQVTDLLAENQSKESSSRTPFGAETSGTSHPRVFRQPTVPGCVRDGIGRNDAALAVENGRYQGKKAMLVLLPDAADATRVTAYVVDATCVDQSASTASGKILLQRSYPSA
ncbi:MULTISPECIES: anti-sigma factor family protein [unclassified Streptomyces]|uniref:anti-sigma factor family protein n=1 Tax=unclassified Streptomyces TaxID=2593676 RepID=UPI0004BDE1F3|nr:MULTISPECIES: membrane protein [unclassified Streptomyces]